MIEPRLSVFRVSGDRAYWVGYSPVSCPTDETAPAPIKPMNVFLRPLRVLFLFACLGFACRPAFAQSAPTGAIEGRVFNAATGTALRNARISIEGTDRETTTDDLAPIASPHPPGRPASM